LSLIVDILDSLLNLVNEGTKESVIPAWPLTISKQQDMDYYQLASFTLFGDELG
jgi:hypothetical protein